MINVSNASLQRKVIQENVLQNQSSKMTPPMYIKDKRIKLKWLGIGDCKKNPTVIILRDRDETLNVFTHMVLQIDNMSNKGMQGASGLVKEIA